MLRIVTSSRLPALYATRSIVTNRRPDSTGFTRS